MKLCLSMILGFLTGLVAHQGKPVLRRNLGGGWFEMACYAAGILVSVPTYVAMFKSLSANSERLLVSYFMTFYSVGMGVGMGYFLDEERRGARAGES